MTTPKSKGRPMGEEASAVVDLKAYVPSDVRELAKQAYLARHAFEKAMRDKTDAMRAFSESLKRHGLKPSQLQVGELCGQSLVPAMDWFDEKGKALS